MRVEQKRWNGRSGWCLGQNDLSADAQWVLAFGGRDIVSDPARFDEIRKMYPKARIVCSTTAGEILPSGSIVDESIALTAVHLEKASINVHQENIAELKDSQLVGERLGTALQQDDLTHVFVISDGHHINGDALVRGLKKNLGEQTAITGGLAGDGTLFEKTLVGMDAVPKEGNVVAVGLYGQDIKVGFGCVGGWNPFGPMRKVTRSSGNLLHELDEKNALELYKTYLGNYAKDLPAFARFFPLFVSIGNDPPVARTILSVDEKNKTMTFAGEIPEGASVQIMYANFDHIIDGAEHAAKSTLKEQNNYEFAILVSCVGRRLVLGPHTEEEVNRVKQVLGEQTKITGFYSYGEISPLIKGAACSLHNQTMSVTAFKEIM
ncbi:FIST C-terminal domain-containing protein [Simkania negevensis]|uniref:FIST C-terminal domain-containing protein n=1 Tax=Simkania negevensis TaxID=83561 RepID=A0ABS3AV56_9BACT|nr:FIST C-terminal domain-containing protein [Simkania negevensis]